MPAPARAKKPALGALSLQDRIRQRAYERYIERGGQSGSDVDDWLAAEQEILREESIDEASRESFPASDAPAR
jgi:hypothetical protein